MDQMVFEWKEFNVNVEAFVDWIKEQCDSCTGASCDYKLTVHFSVAVEDKMKAKIQKYWDKIGESHEMATSYVSGSDLKAEKSAKKQSARNKLLALGLTDEEIDALNG